jgi:RNA polymerase sigma factor (sigma-70 family)
MPSGSVTPIQHCLDRLAAGDPSARGELFRVSRERLLLMTRKMLAGYPGLRRWEESDDVLQNVLVRLDRSLAELSLDSPHDFLNLAAAQIRRELIDLSRHYFGPEGLGANHATPNVAGENPAVLGALPDSGHDPARLISWAELHERIAGLADEEREMFDLLWYNGLSQNEAAALLGVSVRTVRRRWQAARLSLAGAFDGELPI